MVSIMVAASILTGLLLQTGASVVAQMVKNLPATQEMQVQSLMWEGEGNGNPIQYFCPESSMDRGVSWATNMKTQKVKHS